MRSRNAVATLVSMVLFAGCSDPAPTELPGPTLGSLEISTNTTGPVDVQPAGYGVSVDGDSGRSIAVNATLTVAGLSAGAHSVELLDVPWNCAVAGDNPRTVSVTAGATAQSEFSVSCEAPPPLTGRIAFWSMTEAAVNVHIMEADGSGRASLGRGAEPAISPDGERILFLRDGDVWVMDADGTGAVNLTNDPALDFRPRWSPDGSRIAFTSDRAGSYEIFVMNADGSDPVNLTRSGGADNAATWSPDGSRIAFTSNRTGEFEIFVMNADGSDPVNLTSDPLRSDWGPAWSPEGGRIAYVSSLSGGDAEIFVMNTDGSDPANLTNDPAFDTWPSWSPDGEWLAFSTNRTGRYQVFVMRSDGSSPFNLSRRPQIDHFVGFPQGWGPAGIP